MKDPIKVSVCIVTYNQARYIEQALLSALHQRVRFPVEVIVGDDGSTDGTADVIRRVAARYPQLKAILHPKNIGIRDNYLSVHDSAQGEFVAHLDGDDYWLPGKLQAQVDFMEARPNCSISWHPMIAFDEIGSHFIVGDPGRLVRALFGKDAIQLADAMVAYGVTGFHSSNMYRRKARTLYSYHHDFLIDYRLSLALLEQGAGYHMKRPLGCYRAFHDNSATRGAKDFVGPGLLRTFRDYAGSHPDLRAQMTAHCVGMIINRTRYQARLVSTLASRVLGGGGRQTTTDKRPKFHSNISMRQHVLGQSIFALNSLKFLWFALSGGKLPRLDDVRNGTCVTAYSGRVKIPKPGFFERAYGKLYRQ